MCRIAIIWFLQNKAYLRINPTTSQSEGSKCDKHENIISAVDLKFCFHLVVLRSHVKRWKQKHTKKTLTKKERHQIKTSKRFPPLETKRFPPLKTGEHH